MTDMLLSTIRGIVKLALAQTNLNSAVSVETDYSEMCVIVRVTNWTEVGPDVSQDARPDVRPAGERPLSDLERHSLEEDFERKGFMPDLRGFPDLPVKDECSPNNSDSGAAPFDDDDDDGNWPVSFPSVGVNVDSIQGLCMNEVKPEVFEEPEITNDDSLDTTNDGIEEIFDVPPPENRRPKRTDAVPECLELPPNVDRKRKRKYKKKMLAKKRSLDLNSMQLVKVKTKKPKRVYECDQCGFMALGPSKLERHKTIHSEDKPYACSLCDARLKREDSLRKHMAIHMGDKPFKCDQCAYECLNQGALNQHMVVHSDVKRFSCEFCEFTTKTKPLIKKHMEIMHGQNQLYKCPQCDHKTINEYSHRIHMRGHELNTSFACTICAKLFVIERDLKLHMRLHNGQRKTQKIPCPECKKECKSKNDLSAHMFIHTGEMPFKCRICSSQFRHYSSLTKHFKKIHPNETVYYCGICDFRSNEKIEFKRHNTSVHKATFHDGDGDEVLPMPLTLQ